MSYITTQNEREREAYRAMLRREEAGETARLHRARKQFIKKKGREL